MWVFRLSLRPSGKPATVCPAYMNQQDIKKEIKRYRREVPPIDHNSYPELKMNTLINELFKYRRLRQGWGMKLDNMDLDLRKENPENSDLPSEEWIKNFEKLHWRIWKTKVNCRIAMGRWNILKLMKDMRIGDIIFIPRIPDDGKFTVATVKKEYYFQKLGKFIGFGHVIEVKKIKEFNYKGHFPPKIFNPYRKAICEIGEDHQNFKTLSNFINKYYI